MNPIDISEIERLMKYPVERKYSGFVHKLKLADLVLRLEHWDYTRARITLQYKSYSRDLKVISGSPEKIAERFNEIIENPWKLIFGQPLSRAQIPDFKYFKACVKAANRDEVRTIISQAFPYLSVDILRQALGRSCLSKEETQMIVDSCKFAKGLQ